MSIDWASKRGVAIAFNSDAAKELEDYHPKPDGYHFVQIREDSSTPGGSTFTMTTSDVDRGVTGAPGDGFGWGEESSAVIESLKLHRDKANPDILVGAPAKPVFELGWRLTNWRMELHEVELPSGTIIEVVSDTLTWQRQNEDGVPSDSIGEPLPAGQSPKNITTRWDWRIVRT